MSSRAAAIVLAAGLGTRFGQAPKLIASLAGKPILQHVLDTLRQANISPVVVVLGHASPDVRAAIEWADETQVVNRHPERGLLRSVLLGLKRLSETWSLPERTLIVLGDQPGLSSTQVVALLSTSVDDNRPFVVPRYEDGQTGNPVLLEANGRYAVEQLLRNSRPSADRGLGQFFAAFPDRLRIVDLPGTNPDVDTQADLARLQAPETVARGYDGLGRVYAEWSSRVLDPARERFVGELAGRLPTGAAILDVGCGPGLPTTQQLAAKFDVTGLDVSRSQLELARRNVPGAHFVLGDVLTADFPARRFDAVTALYSLTHVARNRHSFVLIKIARWLRPGGLLLATLSADDSPDWTGEWLGQQMFFSGYDAATNRQLLSDAGFEILRDEEVEIAEPEGPARFQWLLAQTADQSRLSTSPILPKGGRGSQ